MSMVLVWVLTVGMACFGGILVSFWIFSAERRGQVQALEKTNRAHVDHISGLQSVIDRTCETVESLKASLVESGNECAMLRAKAENAENEIDILADELDVLQRKCDNYEVDITEVRAKAARHTDRVNALSQGYSAIKDIINELYE